ncbi:hypothetical protein KO353_15870 [Elioraea tepida]|uniref:Uncharacterized protein n=1 Tax=Elioraea tepida TaxID=2843330 RepID=A0A975U2Q7_9PROT|nr:hypothetical protein [Elioraea tepida]QXM24673.1 hypothetical protein KO353_15870 [Elioraea tepida]
MPSVRTASAPTSVPNRVATTIAAGTVIHHARPRLTCSVPEGPRIATM